MRVLISIDDTDNLESIGTGEIAAMIADGVQQSGWGSTGIVTRHQLLVHPDIPYTSHNSAMCFTAELAQEEYLEKVVAFACDLLERESAEGSDPGLCVAVHDRLGSPETLTSFGRRAKLEVIPMDDAYDLADRLGIHLSAHGGTGQGVIGALAGAGLRLWGNDGRMRGSLRFPEADGVLRVAQLREHPEIEEVSTLAGDLLDPDDLVAIGDKPKTVMLNGRSVLLLSPAPEGMGAAWQTAPRKQLRGY